MKAKDKEVLRAYRLICCFLRGRVYDNIKELERLLAIAKRNGTPDSCLLERKAELEWALRVIEDDFRSL